MEKYLISISEIIKDYRKGEVEEITPEHVKRWIVQFDKSEQLVLLKEMDHILNNYYLSRNIVKEYLRSALLHPGISSKHPKQMIKNFNFLRIQEKGQSQNDMLLLVDEVLKEEFGLTIDECGGSNTFFYIDDCIFTGNRFRYDLVPWIEKQNFRPGSKIISIHVAHHSRGVEYSLRHINAAAERKKIEVSAWRFKEINNDKLYGNNIEVLWPVKCTNDIDVQNYYQKVKEICRQKSWQDTCYRTHTLKNDNLFTSSKTRDIVEGAFLRVGAKLVASAANPAESMRPLGFEKLESLGFGSMFITYRNISNNCPLALWYGDPTHVYGPLSLWYPLLIRKTQDSRVFFSLEDLS